MKPQLYRTLFYWLMLLCFGGCPPLWADASDQLQNNASQRTRIHFDDLKNNYRIIGRLGKPVGTFHTIHGTWKRFNFSGRQLFFEVTHVDFRQLTEPQLYPERHFKVALPWEIDQSRVDPDHSLIYEYRVWESLEYFGTPDDFWKESGLPESIGVLPGFKIKFEKEFLPLELTSELNYVKVRSMNEEEANSRLAKLTVADSRLISSPQKRDISFYNLRDQYQILGRLGKPLGEYSAIRGYWQKGKIPRGRDVYHLLLFHVTHLNGSALEKPIIFDRKWSGVQSYGGLPFDPPVGKPVESEIWEMRVVEVMRHKGMAAGYNREAGFIEQHNSVFELYDGLLFHSRPKIVRYTSKSTEPAK